VNSLVELQPIGIYTIPEISYCGQTEDALTTSSVPYEVGISRYRELARGQIIGDSYGMLKLLVSTETRRLLGVHVFGSQATELVPPRPGDHDLQRARSTSSSTPSSTTRRCRRRTRWPRWTR
jgi:hypothetical protein